MRHVILILLVVFGATLAISQKNTISFNEEDVSPLASLDDVAWIAGHWQGEALGGIVEEIWSPPLGNSMMCVFRLIEKDVVNFYEIVTITEYDQTLLLRLKHFSNELHGWEEKDETVDFRLVKMTENKVYFDEFTFERVNNDELNIYVVFGSSGEEMKFNYKRVK